MLYIGLVLITIFSGALSYFIAEKRNADKKFWLVMGIVFGPFALPFVFMAKKLRNECIVQEENQPAFDSTADYGFSSLQ